MFAIREYLKYQKCTNVNHDDWCCPGRTIGRIPMQQQPELSQYNLTFSTMATVQDDHCTPPGQVLAPCSQTRAYLDATPVKRAKSESRSLERTESVQPFSTVRYVPPTGAPLLDWTDAATPERRIAAQLGNYVDHVEERVSALEALIKQREQRQQQDQLLWDTTDVSEFGDRQDLPTAPPSPDLGAPAIPGSLRTCPIQVSDDDETQDLALLAGPSQYPLHVDDFVLPRE